MNKEEKKLSNLHTIRNPICERSEDPWKRCKVGEKKEKKEKYRRSFRWSNFSQWLTMGIWTKNGEKALTGEWRERNDRKTDTLWQREWNKRWPWGGVYWRRDHELGKDREKDLSGLILENKLVEQRAFKKVESEKDLLSFEGNRSDNSLRLVPIKGTSLSSSS